MMQLRVGAHNIRIYWERYLPRYACWQWREPPREAPHIGLPQTLRHGDLIVGWSTWLQLLDVVYPERERLVGHNVD
jgi:hypothetical protein